jgi:hypothetical protein
MADTGAPYFIPFAEPTDLVRDWPTLSEDVALAVAAGLDGAGGLVEVKSVVKTDTQTVSLAPNGTFTVSGLTIAHSVAEATNKVILIAQVAGRIDPSSSSGLGLSLLADSTELNIGDAASNRGRISGFNLGAETMVPTTTLIAVHAPGVTTSVTYGVQARSLENTLTRNGFINRTAADNDQRSYPRAASVLILMEVKV